MLAHGQGGGVCHFQGCVEHDDAGLQVIFLVLIVSDFYKTDCNADYRLLGMQEYKNHRH